ncbi:Protein CYP-14A3, partial [Aphelenchoides avenae]
MLQLRGKKDWTECVNDFSKRYGPVFTVFMPAPHVVLADYDAVREALITKGEHFVGKPNNPFVEYMAYIPNGGVFPSEGENWRHQRRLALSILRDMGMGKDLMEER